MQPGPSAFRGDRDDTAHPRRPAQLGDIVPVGDVWARPRRSPRDRSLVTVSVQSAMKRPDQRRSHLALACTNGVTRDELIESITHLAFHAAVVTTLGRAHAASRTRRVTPLTPGTTT